MQDEAAMGWSEKGSLAAQKLYVDRNVFFRGAPIAPDAAARRMRRNVGHSMWLGAGQAAA